MCSRSRRRRRTTFWRGRGRRDLSARVIGRVGGDAVAIKGEPALALAELAAAHEAWLPGYMGNTLT